MHRYKLEKNHLALLKTTFIHILQVDCLQICILFATVEDVAEPYLLTWIVQLS